MRPYRVGVLDMGQEITLRIFLIGNFFRFPDSGMIERCFDLA